MKIDEWINHKLLQSISTRTNTKNENYRESYKLLGFEAQISLEEGLRRLVSWWREQKLAKETSNV
ncbi:hypothetical protein [Anabaena sp. CCY 9614]|uniref:hypothetical protein n=1 Tax=Anabaena sp. CCY 9614 TaxID=3103869 RepID=UPI0039C5E5F1